MIGVGREMAERVERGWSKNLFLERDIK